MDTANQHRQLRSVRLSCSLSALHVNNDRKSRANGWFICIVRIVSGNHKALHAQSRIQDIINARLEEITFRKGMATGASALVFFATAGLVTAELVGQGNPASGALSGQAGGAPLLTVTTPSGPASAPAAAVPSHPLRHPHAQPRPSSRSAAGRSPSASMTGVPGQSPGTGGVQAPAPAVSATPLAGSRPGSGHWWPGGDGDGWHYGGRGGDNWYHGGRDGDGWHHGDQGWDGWGPGGGDPWHGGHHW